ncbi:MAG: hypothetical protein WC623_12255 [Pedobacter sp.]|uniref:hypothetical protein n=1 Tax=Pedobacter sp. TaxID=1411316 RepID=UPI00356ACD94
MEKFPLLKNKQVALLRADINTGTVLDIDLGIAFAKTIIRERNDVECGIYGSDPVALLSLDRYNISYY